MMECVVAYCVLSGIATTLFLIVIRINKDMNTMALVERLMGLEEPKIPVHTFFAAQSEVIRGAVTVAQVKTYFAMDAAAQAEYDSLVATAPTGSTATALANKALFMEKVHAVFILAEDVVTQYTTPAEVRSKLGI
jgi:hypothetical protein